MGGLTYLMKDFLSEFCRLTRCKGIQARVALYRIPDEDVLIWVLYVFTWCMWIEARDFVLHTWSRVFYSEFCKGIQARVLLYHIPDEGVLVRVCDTLDASWHEDLHKVL